MVGVQAPMVGKLMNGIEIEAVQVEQIEILRDLVL
jgi:hypothetical protein